VIDVEEGIVLEAISVRLSAASDWDVAPYTYQISAAVTLEVKITSGSNIVLTWSLADDNADTDDVILGPLPQENLLTIDHVYEVPGPKVITIAAQNQLDNPKLSINLNIISAMSLKDWSFTSPVIVNRTITYTAELAEAMEMCFIYIITSMNADAAPVEVFWMGYPAELCKRSKEFTDFEFDATRFHEITAGELVFSVDKVITLVGRYSVSCYAYTAYGTPVIYLQTLVIDSVPCDAPVLTTQVGQGDSFVNTLVYRRSNMISVGTDKVCNILYTLYMGYDCVHEY